MSGDNLKPCPACGQIDKGSKIGGVKSFGGGWRIECRSCGTSGPMFPEYCRAFSAWNAMPRRRDEKIEKQPMTPLDIALSDLDTVIHATLPDALGRVFAALKPKDEDE